MRGDPQVQITGGRVYYIDTAQKVHTDKLQNFEIASLFSSLQGRVRKNRKEIAGTVGSEHTGTRWGVRLPPSA